MALNWKLFMILIVPSILLLSTISFVASDIGIGYQPEPRACDISANCTRQSGHQFCFNGQCKCEPNYLYKDGQCVKVSCYGNPEVCTSGDPNRFCEEFPWRYGRCICMPGFIEDPVTKACRKLCVEDSEPSCELMDTENTVCNVYRCQCKENHRRDSLTGQCLPFVCEKDSHCWSEGDKLRTCSNNTCACAFEVDPLTQRCVIRISSILNIRYYQSWRSEKILLATIIFVPIIFYYCLCQNYRKARSTLVYLKNPSPGQTFYSHQATLTKSQLAAGNEEKKIYKIGSDNKDVRYERFA